VATGAEPAAGASLRIRLVSLLYEALLLAALLMVATAAFVAVGGQGGTQPGHALLQAWLLLVMGTYFVWSWGAGRRTLPMRTWRLRLVDRAGRPLPTRTALLRFIVAAIALPLGAAALWWALIDRDRLFLHDRLAGTRLVRDPPAAAGRG
jgi:uncharacterized RDD family membrane protein YckC